jgi:hypothetical protein
VSEESGARERLRHLMMAALDQEIDPDRRATMALRKPPEEVWSSYWTSVYNRAERGLGWILASVGAIVLLSYGLWKAFWGIVEDTGMPSFLKLAILAVIVGGAVLLVSVVREKLFTRTRDPYKEVQR